MYRCIHKGYAVHCSYYGCLQVFISTSYLPIKLMQNLSTKHGGFTTKHYKILNMTPLLTTKASY